MVTSVKTPLISVDFGSALKNMRTDIENLSFWSLGKHRPCLTHHSKTAMQQSSFPWPLSCGPHLFLMHLMQSTWHGVIKMESNMGPWSGKQISNWHGWRLWESFADQMFWLSMGSLKFKWISPCFPLLALPFSTSVHDCAINVSPRRVIKTCSEWLGKLLTLFSELKKSSPTTQNKYLHSHRSQDSWLSG